MKEENLTLIPIVSWFNRKMENQQVEAFIRLFMKVNPTEARNLTLVDFFKFAKTHPADTRCQSVALFYRAVDSIIKRLHNAGFSKRANMLRRFIYETRY